MTSLHTLEADHPMPEYQNEAGCEVFPLSEQRLQSLLPNVFLQTRFEGRDIQSRIARATRELADPTPLGLKEKLTLLLKWGPSLRHPDSTIVAWIVFDHSRLKARFNAKETEEVGQVLRRELRPSQERGLRQEPDLLMDPVAPPGTPFNGLFSGTLRDYSGCATEAELRDLSKGVLPLGTYAFQPSAGVAISGAPLYLSEYRPGARMEYNGVLVCAPQNSGKTALITRWARAANSAGYNLFIVDVKGNLYEKLMKDPKHPLLKGSVRYFSTDPLVDCDCINFLSGYNQFTAIETEHIRQLVAAIIPGEDWAGNGGRDLFYYRNQLVWLTAIIRILKLGEHYYKEHFENGKRSADLGDLYDLVSDEQLLNEWVQYILFYEQKHQSDNQPTPQPGIKDWLREISPLLNPEVIPGGQRTDARYSFRDYTAGMVQALEPFSKNGTLYRKIRDVEKHRTFRFEDLLAPGPDGKPVTVILAAREQDMAKAETVLSMAVKRLQQILFERMSIKNPQPILLLLDETRRIRSFKANEYITFAREAKAGCVVVYQSLDQIGDEKKIYEMLENVGTQIYLGSLVGNTARYFISILPKRHRTTYSENVTYTSTGPTKTLAINKELVDFFITNELYNLPAGKYPALIYINDQPRRKPFLVSLYDPLLDDSERSTAGEPAHGQVARRSAKKSFDRRTPDATKPDRRQPADQNPSRQTTTTAKATEDGTRQPVLIVSPHGDAHYRTIAEAVGSAQHGARIVIKPGLYHESLILDKGLEIIGEAGAIETVIESDGSSCISIHTDDRLTRISGLTLRCTAPEGLSVYAIDIIQGAPSIQSAEISSDSSHGVRIRNGAAPELRDCRIHGAKQCGILIEHASVTLASCDVFASTDAGICIDGGSDVSIQHCTIHGNGSAGIVTSNSTIGSVTDSSILDNEAAGIVLQTGSSLIVRESKINGNQQEGVRIETLSYANVELSDLTGNARGAWSIEPGSQMERSQNRE